MYATMMYTDANNNAVELGRIEVLRDGTTGVDDIATDTDDNAPVTYYTLQGVQVENPTAGLYIARQGNQVSKVLIR